MGPGDSSLEAYASLGDDRNKPKNRDVSEDTQQGIVSEKVSELTLDMEDKDILILVEKWEKAWKDSPKKQEWEKQIDENEKYWLGNQHDLPRSDKSRARVDNLIFEALETYLPQATRRNPDPIVSLDTTEKSEEGNEDPVKTAYVEKVKNRLADLADKNRLRLKLKKGARHWAIYQLGVAKFGWDLDQDIPVVRIVRPKRIILDPDATIDEDGYNGNRVGEYRKLDAERIKAIIKDEPTSAEGIKKIDEMVDGKTGTEIQFIEWWVNEYMCWTLGKTVLLKKKNPHWNYDKTENPDPTNISDPNVQVDEFGTATAVPVKIPGINHFASPKMPYTFLSVFNLGDQPMDKTSLIGQNLSNQDKINKRNKQIDKNADRMNGGMVVSLERSGLTQGQAKNVSEALRKGGVVTIPTGSPREAIDQYSPSGLPADVFNDLVDTRSRLRDIFGVAGSSAAGIQDEKTVRGKIISRATDTDRIGGGVTEYLEQWADDWYNWLLQLLYVYDPGFQFIGGGVPPKVIVSVKEGSLLPKDSTSIANQAIELGTQNKMALVDMYKRLEYPNPEELAANVWLEINAPQLLYADNPKVQQALQMQAEAAAAQAEADAQSKTNESMMKHDQNIESKLVDGSVKKSLLSEVPSKQ